ncbi:hypothetical protein [uncultured Amnibacterium sp.]|uniref:hypothetical protein n=1 Tax=uncultured Amnibacterium sp. TaxID=1631851 RepID=UPI0035C9D8D7
MTAIDWPAFALVLLSSLVAAVGSVSLFSVGVRLLATPATPSAVDPDLADVDDDGEDDPIAPTGARPRAATAGAAVAIALAALVALGGVVLIIH